MAKIIKEELIATVECPVRLMFGIGNNWMQGFSVVYEEKGKNTGAFNVWYDSHPGWEDRFKKVRFIDEDEGTSRVVFKTVRVTKKDYFNKYSTNERRIKEILIRRDFQMK